MGDISIAQDLLDGVAEALGVLGSLRNFRLVSTPPVDISNPGETPVETPTDYPLDAYLYAFDNEYMPEANILDGSLMAILSIESLTSEQIEQIEPGNRLIDTTPPGTYEIVRANLIEVAGIKVTAIVQLKG